MVANGPEGDRSHASWRSQPQADCRQAAVLRAGTSRTEGGCGSPPSGVSTSCGSKWFSEAGSTIIPDTPVSPRFLTQDDRIAIADGLRAGKAPASIAAAIGKSTSTVYREIGRGRRATEATTPGGRRIRHCCADSVRKPRRSATMLRCAS
ncbi:helix-turn-helix domain-containing protein [Streptomyces mirabilis]|uniref:helix-turn-helix domain-containing protein n=1 Tax=Streptomyces mirabilis TaxID=68239 RepID=UPI0036A2A21C